MYTIGKELFDKIAFKKFPFNGILFVAIYRKFKAFLLCHLN